MSTILFAALLPIRVPQGTADSPAAAIGSSVLVHLATQFDRKDMGVLTPEEPVDWQPTEFSGIARKLAARFIVGIEVLALGDQNVSAPMAPGAQFLLSAKVLVHVWDAQAGALLIDGAVSEAEEQVGVPGPGSSFVDDGFVRVVTAASGKALARLLGGG